MSAEQERLEAAIGYSFRDSGLLRRALTHKSYAHEQPAMADAVSADNEQLEFLGDAILGFLASELLIDCFPALAEGRLSKLKARLVSADHLHKVALSLDLGRYLVLGKGEVNVLGCLRVLKEHGYNGMLSLETEGEFDAEEGQRLIEGSRSWLTATVASL